MKKLYGLVFSLFIMANAVGQKNFNDSIADSRNHITETAMLTLGGWAAANIATGFIIAGQTQGQHNMLANECLLESRERRARRDGIYQGSPGNVP